MTSGDTNGVVNHDKNLHEELIWSQVGVLALESQSSQDMEFVASVSAASLLPTTARCHRACDVMGD
ncbi:hypothetical protein TSMEX_007126 [Taenia solium]|eukprot:TsM_000393000 transcript=TsM_000393000 gene=TsM_000393000